jgi:hypothetical protein
MRQMVRQNSPFWHHHEPFRQAPVGAIALLLTTQIYVPYQQFGGLEVLGIERGCSVYCCGVDAASSYLPAASAQFPFGSGLHSPGANRAPARKSSSPETVITGRILVCD